MSPFAFSVENALEILPDEYRKQLTDEARRYAEEGREPREDFGEPGTYWDGVVLAHRRILWLDAYQKRRARIERMKVKS